MKKNNKGFTLIELLAVVVILLAISVMAISSISAAIERNKLKQDEAKIRIIESYAETYYDSHKNTIGVGDIINLSDLGLSDEEKTNADGDLFPGCVLINRDNEGTHFTYLDDCTISK